MFLLIIYIFLFTKIILVNYSFVVLPPAIYKVLLRKFSRLIPYKFEIGPGLRKIDHNFVRYRSWVRPGQCISIFKN